MSHIRSALTTRLLLGGAICALVVSGCAVPGNSGESPSTVSASSAGSASAAIPAADETRLDDIQAAGRLRICSTGDYPPFTKQEQDGAWVGIDVDMARNLAETLKVEPEFVKTSWKTLMDDYTGGKCDVAVGGISLNPDRAQRVYFSMPTQEDGKTPIARCEDIAKYDTIDEINQPGVRSIFPEGGTNEKFARTNYPQGQLMTHDNLTVFDALAAGRPT